MALNANQIIDITTRISAGGLGVSNFGVTMLFMNETEMKSGAASWTEGTHKEFAGPDEILDFVASNSEPHKAVSAYFSVVPRPRSIKVFLKDSAISNTENLALAADKTWFYFFDTTVASRSLPAWMLTIQSWAQANGKMLATSEDSNQVIDSATSSDSISQMKNTGARYSFVGYHPTDNYIGLRIAALFSSVDYAGDNTVISAFGKRLPGLTPLDLNQSAYSTLNDKGAVYYTKIESGQSVDNGRLISPFTTSSYNESIFEVVALDALVDAMRANVYNYLMNTTTFIPQTPPGQQGAIDAVTQICEQFYRNGFLGARQYTDELTGETKTAEHGYVITTRPEDIFLLSDADRDAKKLYPIRARVFKAGAAFEASITLDVE